MFRRRSQPVESAQDAERKALFAELAKRPDTVCPFLGLADARTDYREGVSEEHRCYAFGDPAELSAEQQTKVCLQRGYGNCPRYLRGVLVIPTEELEALRHPLAPAPAPEPAPVAAGGGGRRIGVVAGALVLVLAVGGGLAAFFALRNNDGVAVVTASPSPTLVPSPSAPPASTQPSASPTQEATPEPTPSPTPVVVPSGGALPTPGPDDTPTGFAVRVDPGRIDVVEMEHDGVIDGPAVNSFDNQSWAPVERIKVDGSYYWRTLQGGYTGRAYSRDLSDAFVIFETYETPDGDPTFRLLEAGEYFP